MFYYIQLESENGTKAQVRRRNGEIHLFPSQRQAEYYMLRLKPRGGARGIIMQSDRAAGTIQPVYYAAL